MRTSLSFIPVFLVVSACTYTHGNGHVVTQERQIEPFRKVVVQSGIELNGVVGSRSLTITTDENIMPIIETFVDGDTLTVRRKPDADSDARVIVFVNNDAFESIAASGGSDVRVPVTPVPSLPVTASGGSQVHLTGLSSTDLSLDLNGGSSVTISGAASRATAAVNGGSELHLRDVPLESLSLTVNGGSFVEARVSSTLTGTASGGSNVTIVGTPSSNVVTSGESQVSLGEP